MTYRPAVPLNERTAPSRSHLASQVQLALRPNNLHSGEEVLPFSSANDLERWSNYLVARGRLQEPQYTAFCELRRGLRRDVADLINMVGEGATLLLLREVLGE